MKIAIITSFILSLTVVLSRAQAVPGLLSYQGKIVDAGGVGLGTGTPVSRNFLFRLFDAPTGGTRLWSEVQSVSLSNGEFSVILGQGSPAVYGGITEAPRPSLLTAFGSSNRYLEIVVESSGDGNFDGNDAVITPRQRFIATPFVFRASLADGIAGGSDFNLKDVNYGLGWYGTNRPFNGINISGPVLYGLGGGALGAVTGANRSMALRWTSNGNVGIGNSSPSEKLDVAGNGKVTGNLSVGGMGTFSGGAAIAPPSFNGGGAGMRLTLWPGAVNETPFGMGIDGGTLYSVVPSSASHKWYGGTVQGMSLNGSNGNLGVTGSVNAASVSATSSVTTPSITATGGISAASLTSGGGLSFGGGGANPTEGGNTGNFIGFSTLGSSADFLGYSSNVFYMKDSPGSDDVTQPDLVIGASLRANKVNANGKATAIGEEDLRLIRGVVKGENNAVNPVHGAGFTSRKARNSNQTVNNAVYEVIFTSPFSGVPTVTAGYNQVNAGWGNGRLFVTIYDPSSTGFKFIVHADADAGSYHGNEYISFVAVGPR